MKKNLLKAASFMAFCLFFSNASISATLSYDFDLPSTGLPSSNPGYPSVATLTIEDISGGVQMTLTPNWTSSGWQTNGESVQSLNIIFPNLASSTASYVSGADIKSIKFGNGNMDSGYSSTASDLQVKFKTSNSKDFDSSIPNSVWNILASGLTTSSFDGIAATANNKTSPIFGIISVQGYSLNGLTPTPSNWVSGSSAVPLPAAAWLFGSAMFGMAGIGYRRKIKVA